MYDDKAEEDVICVVCMTILVDPTTLNCGHTVCRHCLAGWYLSTPSRNQACPTCRKQWEGFPEINTAMRNFIERLYPEKIARRRQELQIDRTNQRNCDNFERELKQKKPAPIYRTVAPRANNFLLFWCGIAVALAAFVLFYMIYGVAKPPTNVIDKGKSELPVATWKTGDVENWLTYLGWARKYIENARLQEIDGPDLMDMGIAKLLDMLNVSDEHHRNALQVAVMSLRESGVQMPQTIWEYKALYPVRSLFLSSGLNNFPRCTFLLLYLFRYDDCFLPFLHTTVPRTWDENVQIYKLPSPTWSQQLMFMLMMLVFPYGMVGVFAWSLRSSHTLTHLLVCFTCFLHTIFELSFYSTCLFEGRWRDWKRMLWPNAKSLLIWIGVTIISQYIWTPFLSFYFYINMYYTPVKLAKAFHQTFILQQHR